ncbi:MAG: hypothetical protein EBU26_18120 [Verrucomicrobia bacterium]|jgi:hypothetical protein|nr:hypothetical protein [Verrucomicrobiota bacterium]
MLYDFAVQPAYWSSFDQHGCMWATSLRHAELIAEFHMMGEECIIWKVPHKGEAMKWMRAGGKVDQVDQIADLVFGC